MGNDRQLPSYLVRGFDGKDVKDHPADTLTQAVAILHRENGIAETAGPDVARSILRWWSLETGHALRIWGRLADGRWLSLDPEQVQDAVRSPDEQVAFENRILAPSNPQASLTYRVRIPDVEEGDIIADCSSLPEAFRRIADELGYNAPIGPGFTWGLLRADIDRKDVSLCVRLPGTVAAVHLLLTRAEEVFASNHTAIDLIGTLRSEFIRQH